MEIRKKYDAKMAVIRLRQLATTRREARMAFDLIERECPEILNNPNKALSCQVNTWNRLIRGSEMTLPEKEECYIPRKETTY